MSRSIKKGPFVQERLLKRIQDMNESGKMVDITETAAEREEEACTQLGLSA